MAEQICYGERSAGERVNGGLKDNHGGRTVRVRGPEKVMCHLMFGILSFTVLQLMRLRYINGKTRAAPPPCPHAGGRGRYQLA